MKLTKLSSALLAGGLLMMGVAAQAEEAAAPFTVAGSVALTSDYFYRGVSQTSSTSAIQGSFTLNHSSGLYASVWSSSIGFAQGQELDPSIGFAGKAGELGYDIGVLEYGYPGERTLGFREVYGSLSYMGGKFGLAYSDDFFGGTGASIYTYLDYGTTVGPVGLVAHVGLNKFDEDAMSNYDGYVDYKVGVNYALSGVTFELAYIGSDLDDTDCAAFSATDDKVCKGKAVVTASKAF
ncbi:MAG: TorF family putative porin [Pedobacter sp.]|nr:TorF family putative porin [Pedobacter sp.]